MSQKAALLVRNLYVLFGLHVPYAESKPKGFPVITIWKRLTDIETEEFRHYFVQVLRVGQVIWGLYFAHGRTDGRMELLELTRGFVIYLTTWLIVV
jgi:hypothetical protein